MTLGRSEEIGEPRKETVKMRGGLEAAGREQRDLSFPSPHRRSTWAMLALLDLWPQSFCLADSHSPFLFADKYPEFVCTSHVCCSREKLALFHIKSFPSHSSPPGEATAEPSESGLLSEMSGKPAEDFWEVIFSTVFYPHCVDKRKELLREKNFYSTSHPSLLAFERLS